MYQGSETFGSKILKDNFRTNWSQTLRSLLTIDWHANDFSHHVSIFCCVALLSLPNSLATFFIKMGKWQNTQLYFLFPTIKFLEYPHIWIKFNCAHQNEFQLLRGAFQDCSGNKF